MKRKGERVTGPYEQSNGTFRVVRFDEEGRGARTFETEREAVRYMELFQADLARDEHTTETALKLYRVKMADDDGSKPSSIETTAWAINSFFPTPEPLHTLTAKRCAKLYDELRARPSERTKKPPSADTHRNILVQARSFLGWCAKKGWLRGENPLEDVDGVGKRRPRGLSLGKSGNELLVKQTRAWFQIAVFKASRGDNGATAALMALLLGMRASEIVSRQVAHLDTDSAEGDLLWIPCAKTPAGRRTLEVPEPLRELLVRCAANKAPERFLFEASREHERELRKPHARGWVKAQIHRICDAAAVPRVTAHAMRGQLATLSAKRGVVGHVIAAMLGHEDERTTMHAYAEPGAAAVGTNRRGLVLLEGGKRGH